MMINCTKCSKESVCKYKEVMNEVSQEIIAKLNECTEKIGDKKILGVDVKCRYFDFARVTREPINKEATTKEVVRTPIKDTGVEEEDIPKYGKKIIDSEE